MSEKIRVKEFYLQQHISRTKEFENQKRVEEMPGKLDLWTRWNQWVKTVRG